MAYETFAVIADLSSYEPWVNMQKLKDAGVSMVMLRLNYPSSLALADHLAGKGNAVDVCFEKHYAEAYKVDMPVGIYYNHLAVADIEGSFTQTHNQFDFIKRNLSGKRIYAMAIAWEIMYYYNSAGQRTYHTPQNNAKSLKILYADLMNYYALPTWLYTRKTLITEYGGVDVPTWIDNEATLRLWLAYYITHPLAGQTVTAQTFKAQCPTPTDAQRSAYLWSGSKGWPGPGSAMWQVGDKFLMDGVKDELGNLTAIDLNFYNGTQEKLYQDIKYTGSVTPPPVPDPEPEPGDPDTAAALARIEAGVNDIKAALAKGGTWKIG